MLEVQGQAYKSRISPKLQPLLPGTNRTIKKMWGGWLPPVNKLTSQTAGD